MSSNDPFSTHQLPGISSSEINPNSGDLNCNSGGISATLANTIPGTSNTIGTSTITSQNFKFKIYARVCVERCLQLLGYTK